ncbi:MAG TPA: hypothetical protein VM554_11450 [Acidisarcina sp.]|nr:hypothetical protein [Acidisarcina sp.]
MLRSALLAGLLLLCSANLLAVRKPHTVGLGPFKRVPHTTIGDPADASVRGTAATDGDLKIRPIVVDGQVKEWTTGEAHDITDRSFTIRRALHINDTLPTDTKEHWVWQRGSWIVVDRTTGHVTALHLPDYDPAVSDVVWFRDYAAYCGLPSTGKSLYAVVAQVGARRPILAKKISSWSADDHPSPACEPAGWQREPLRVTFNPKGAAPMSFDLIGLSAVLVEEGDAAEPDPQ